MIVGQFFKSLRQHQPRAEAVRLEPTQDTYRNTAEVKGIVWVVSPWRALLLCLPLLYCLVPLASWSTAFLSNNNEPRVSVTDTVLGENKGEDLLLRGREQSGEANKPLSPSSSNDKPESQKAPPPNFLFLFPDGWRADWDGFHPEAAPLKLPIIRSLASKGMRFTHVTVPSPICNPSRAAIITGREYDMASVPNNQISMPKSEQFNALTTIWALSNAGYFTMEAGKESGCFQRHNGSCFDARVRIPGHRGGLRVCNKQTYETCEPSPGYRYGQWLKNQTVTVNNTQVNAWRAYTQCAFTDCHALSLLPGHLQEDRWTTVEAISLLQNRPKDRPFFLQVNFPGPHAPFITSPDGLNAVVNGRFPAPFDVPREDKRSSYQDSVCLPNKPLSERCALAGMMEDLDVGFGMLIEEVQRQGELNRTFVVFSSDHGEMLGDHSSVHKGQPWIGSSNVPLIITGPEVSQGVVHRYPVASVDLAATFLDYAGVATPVGMTSLSLRKVLGGTGPTSRAYVHSGYQSIGFDGNYANLSEIQMSRARFGLGRPISWRLVIEASSYLKFISCKGECPFPPSTFPKFNESNKPMFHEALYNVSADPYEMNPLRNAVASARLCRRLPESFRGPRKNCNQEKYEAVYELAEFKE
mmetsp:Transcript_2563/g.2957  ORF Transcript_2563/g.2957 Transcript_2563/m.2957 type:complete len:639 (-) Transcript_2563:832-2748(-)|eukprot:CAMPEP_0185752462 /NCGR_PEP_ID=MMETSP1174-20130828/11264_1 /TAXON_ID=35687 /ORGANISM="Dictyocha speculum, Strain CCMP1381" /LENGTH=638 /DNA_ID=CAMNT_0028429931 /DNA_START=235 /DNA_END=2151 /DNA_ORIENTATION=+